MHVYFTKHLKMNPVYEKDYENIFKNNTSIKIFKMEKKKFKKKKKNMFVNSNQIPLRPFVKIPIRVYSHLANILKNPILLNIKASYASNCFLIYL